jgi:pimeloyl-ACP methyl ester carboxylesterase
MSEAHDRTFWRDPALGDPRELELPGGRLRIFETGSGPPIVFVHGLLVNANLWRKVVSRLAPDCRCVALDMPLGSHELAMPDADLGPLGLANLTADAIEAAGLEEVTLVGNDTGGGLSQLVVAHRPERIGRLVLTSCDAYDNFPPRFFKFVLAPALIPGAARVVFAPLRVRALRELPIAFGWLMHSKLEPAAGDSYVLPALTSGPIGADARRAMRGISPRHTLDAAKRFRDFERPVLIAWSRDDRFFPADHAERLARDFPNARLEWVEGARTFSAEDQPERLAELIADFVRVPVAVAEQDHLPGK